MKIALKGINFVYLLIEIGIRCVYGITVEHDSMWAKDDNGGSSTEICGWTWSHDSGFSSHRIKMHTVQSHNCSGHFPFHIFYFYFFYFSGHLKVNSLHDHDLACGRQLYLRELFLLFSPKNIMFIQLF